MMLWTRNKKYQLEPFENEADLEKAIVEVSTDLFGPDRVYLPVKKRIGTKGKTSNIPDGYLVDLTSAHEPRLYVVETELAKHEPLKHVAVQILEFSLSFETSWQKIKAIVKTELQKDASAAKLCDNYATENGFENLDYLLEKMISGGELFNALVIIDELDESLESALIKKFKFPVETIELRRFRSAKGERVYEFDPFLLDVSGAPESGRRKRSDLDPSEIDTIVVPAQDEGFEEVFIEEDCWYQIRIRSSMIPKIKYIASYRVAPTSAITHIAEVENIKQWRNTNKYVVNFAAPAKKIRPIKLVPKSSNAPQAPRYTSRARLEKAKNLNDVF